MKILFSIVSLVVGLHLYGQSEVNYKQIDSLGQLFTAKLKKGELDQFKNTTPPENTWSYDRLLDYKNALNDEDVTIYMGDFVQPSTVEDLYAYNLFAFTKSEESDSYSHYFAAVVSVDVSGDQPRIVGAYLFTEKEALKSWWKHVFGFYYNETNKDIPEAYSHPTCPPPPFKD